MTTYTLVQIRNGTGFPKGQRFIPADQVHEQIQAWKTELELRSEHHRSRHAVIGVVAGMSAVLTDIEPTTYTERHVAADEQ